MDVHLVHGARRARVQTDPDLAGVVGDDQVVHRAVGNVAGEVRVGVVGQPPRQVPDLLQLLVQDLGVLDADDGPVGRLGARKEQVVASNRIKME